MITKHLLWSVILGTTLFTVGCGPTYGGRGYGYGSPYRTYDPYYSGGYYDPYYGNRNPYSYGSYDNRSHGQVHRDIERDADRVERKYEKGMRRLDRQEQEAREKAARRFGGNTSDPRYQDRLGEIDRKYDHKRNKVDNLRDKGHRNLDRGHDRYHRGW
ncbi:MAG: hypothetical protein FJ147_25725 [Deltaproteobacteria bacterium]|nr:hypothetical protein [Deltaproteobacteria bacterium]